MNRVLDKFVQAWRLLRYGPTELKQLRMQVQAMAQALEGKAEQSRLQDAQDNLRAELRREAGWLRERLAAQQAAAPGSGGSTTPPSAQADGSAASQAFYLALERQFRLQAYRPWFEGKPRGKVADLGCGRGEWLELVREWGHDPSGVDLNPLFVQQAREQGFDVACSDVLAWLRAQPPGSFAAVTSFHLVEHLPFPVLLQVVEQAWRVLAPGGRLVLETPNPENLSVASQCFWLDPTHQRPLPPPLLEFLVTHAGLEVEATLRLSPPPVPDRPIADETLRELLMQGRDYAVVARKPDAEGR
jgi:SAM-dependent methyltransferase